MDVSVYKNRDELSLAAAHHVGTKIKEVLKKKDEVRMIFAAAASQREFLTELLNLIDIPWNKIIAFQMDEYHTLPKSAPQRFGNFLNKTFYRFRDFKEIHFMNENIEEYELLIKESPIDIVCMGIGENGHLAFNDPPVADFQDPKSIKKVHLDEICRQQQVNDGEFEKLEDVPTKAVTLTIPVLLDAKYISVVVPDEAKAEAVYSTLFDEISEDCPASILRTHSNTKLFLDTESSKLIMSKIQ
tara:strand:- start:23 stop:751 length:729 start_codon:yes stop_codon:yes gene_type:complete